LVSSKTNTHFNNIKPMNSSNLYTMVVWDFPILLCISMREVLRATLGGVEEHQCVPSSQTIQGTTGEVGTHRGTAPTEIDLPP
jgi:hypothetical protein